MQFTASVTTAQQAVPATIDVSAAQALAALLSAATATLDVDRVHAKDCIAKAQTLLRMQAEGGSMTGDHLNRLQGGLSPWQARRITDYICNHLAEKIQADDLADLAMVSTGHFFRAFRESFGEAPMAYVARRRMQYAQQLMLATREPLSQVALACGFSDQAHFTRVFRRVVGSSPLSWRRGFAQGPARI